MRAANAPLTVVFAHGFCLRMGAFHFQRERLAEQWGDQVRMVFYDQRGHGLSGDASPDTFTVPQLGRDLESVLAVMAPRGPVVLVGHSMGGMTVLSHARQYPQRYPTRIVGAALISSAAEGVSRSPLGEILQQPGVGGGAVRRPLRSRRGAPRPRCGPLDHRTRAARCVVRRRESVSPSVVAFSESMMHDTPVHTLVGFLHALEVHDETEGLKALAKIPTLIACGDRDLLTPVEYSQDMAVALPKSELVIAQGAGHLVQSEQPELIDDALVRLVERPPRPNWWHSPAGSRNGPASMAERTGGSAELPTPQDTVALGARLGSELRAGTWWCCRARSVPVKPCSPRNRGGHGCRGPVTSPTYVLARVHRRRRARGAGSGARRHSTGCSITAVTCSVNSTRWTSTPTSITPSSVNRVGRRGSGRAASSTISTSTSTVPPTPRCAPRLAVEQFMTCCWSTRHRHPPRSPPASSRCDGRTITTLAEAHHRRPPRPRRAADAVTLLPRLPTAGRRWRTCLPSWWG